MIFIFRFGRWKISLFDQMQVFPKTNSSLLGRSVRRSSIAQVVDLLWQQISCDDCEKEFTSEQILRGGFNDLRSSRNNLGGNSNWTGTYNLCSVKTYCPRPWHPILLICFVFSGDFIGLEPSEVNLEQYCEVWTKSKGVEDEGRPAP